MNHHDTIQMYLDNGYFLVPVSATTKRPKHSDWPTRTFTEEDFEEGDGIGVKLGTKFREKGYLVDLDADSPESERCFRYIQDSDPTVAFGHATKPCSHVLYISDVPMPSKKFNDPVDGKCLLEIRGTKVDGSIGQQTVFPPSIHATGGARYFESNSLNEPATKSAVFMERLAVLIAIASLVAKHQKDGMKNQSRLALFGFLKKHKITQKECETLATLLYHARNDGDDSESGYVAEVANSFDAEKTYGGPTFIECFGDKAIGKKILDAICKWLKISPIAEDREMFSIDTLTDHTNASLVVQWYGDKIRFLKDREIFLVWNGKHWEENENLLHDYYIQAMKKAQQLSLTLPSDTEDERKRKRETISHFIGSENANRMKNAIFEMPMFQEISCMNAEFDCLPHIITVNNGSVNLETGELSEFKPENKCTRFLQVNYDPKATSDEWNNFLTECFRNRTEVMEYVQKCIGSSLFGDVIQESIFFIVGPGGSGKGTFLNSIASTLGGPTGIIENLKMTSLIDVSRSGSSASPDIAKLSHARIVTSQEVREGQKLSEGILKSLTGGDKISARFNYESEFTFQARFSLWISSNSEPLFDGNDSGMARRVKKIVFDNRPKCPDATLKYRLSQENVVTAILAWIIQGSVAYKKDGLVVPEDVTLWSNDLLNRNNPVQMTMDEYLVYDPSLPASSSITVSAFRKRLDSVLKESGLRGMSRREVKENLEKIGVNIRQALKQDVLVGYKVCPEISKSEFEELNGGESICRVA